MNIRKFWIRRDREQYLVSGLVLTCSIGAFVSSYWHFSDRMDVRASIKINKTLPTEAQQRRLRDTQYVAPKLHSGATRYYRLDDTTLPAVPKLGEDEGN
ncbi:MAG: hypothetical protein HY952_08070 [Elusimicrobia bacterium]|nr:hypothetical protein [Elusimicrobiota bacterium]